MKLCIKVLVLLAGLIISVLCEQTIAVGPNYPDGTLLTGGSAPIYLMENGMRHWIPDMATLNSIKMGLHNSSDVTTIPYNDLLNITLGVAIPSVEKYPTGTLLRGRTAEPDGARVSSDIYVIVQNGSRSWIPNTTGYNLGNVETISWYELMSIPEVLPRK